MALNDLQDALRLVIRQRAAGILLAGLGADQRHGRVALQYPLRVGGGEDAVQDADDKCNLGSMSLYGWLPLANQTASTAPTSVLPVRLPPKAHLFLFVHL